MVGSISSPRGRGLGGVDIHQSLSMLKRLLFPFSAVESVLQEMLITVVTYSCSVLSVTAPVLELLRKFTIFLTIREQDKDCEQGYVYELVPNKELH
jgi:hypothetical protein